MREIDKGFISVVGARLVNRAISNGMKPGEYKEFLKGKGFTDELIEEVELYVFTIGGNFAEKQHAGYNIDADIESVIRIINEDSKETV